MSFSKCGFPLQFLFWRDRANVLSAIRIDEAAFETGRMYTIDKTIRPVLFRRCRILLLVIETIVDLAISH